jgi:hypothetical protein
VERNAVPDDAQVPRDGCPDGPGPEEGDPDRHRSAAGPWAQSAWDASDAARQDVAADVALQIPDLAVSDAEKSAAPEPDDPVPDALYPRNCLVPPAVPDAAAVLCTPDAVQSAERSFAARGAAAFPKSPEARLDVAALRPQLELAVAWKPSPEAPPEHSAVVPRPEAREAELALAAAR